MELENLEGSLSKFFLGKGWNVLFTSTNQENVDILMEELPSTSNLTPFISDLTKQNAAVDLIKNIHSLGHKVNHLVNSARSLEYLTVNSKGQTDRTEFMNEYLIDVVVPYELSIALFNTQSNELNTITNIGSQYGVVAANPYLYDDYLNQSFIQYGVAKAALMHLTKELAVRFASSNIRVNCIAYGGVEGRVDESFKSRYAKLTPSRKMMSDEEISGPLALLLDDDCKAINGQTIQADGGWTLW